MQSIKVIPTGKLLDGQPTETDVVITLDDGSSQTFPVVFPKDMFTVITKAPDLSDYVKNEVLNTIVTQIQNQITNNNTQVQNQISNLPKPPDISPLATKDALSNEITARSNAVSNITDQLTSVESTQKSHGDSITQVQSGLSDETSRAQKAESDLKSKIDNLDSTYVSGQADTGGTAIRELNFASDGAISVKDANGNITKVAKLDDLNSVSTNVEGQISNILNNTIAQSESKLNSRIDQLSADIINGNNQLTQTTQALITNGIQNKNDVADLGVVVQKEISDRQAGEKTLSDKIDTTKSDIETDLSNQKTQVETDLSNAISGVNNTITTNNNARIADNQATNKTLYQEIDDRQAGETALGKRIDQEVSDRQTGDKTNSDAITQEVSDRKADTASLTTQIQNEAKTRSQNDTTISNDLSQEVKDRESADTALTNNLNQEIQRAESAETTITESVTALSNKSITGTPNSSNVSVKSVTLNSPSDLEITDSSGTTTQVITKANLDEEAQTRSTNDQTLQKNIDAETAAREQADQSLNTQMGNIASQLQGAVNTEQSARVAADNALQSKIDSNNTTTQTAISDEAKARSDADTALGNQITQEVSDRKSAITDLQNTLNSTINQEASASAAANTALSSMISTETGNREQADQNLQSALGAETRSRQTADSALQKNIDSTNASLTSETNRAEAAEKTLQSNIDSETSARTTADQSLQTSISNETSRAKSAEETLQNAVSNLNKNTVSNVPDQGGVASESLSFDSNNNVIVKDTNNNKTQLAKESELSTETAARISGDQINAEAISAETSDRKNSEMQIQKNLTDIEGSIQTAMQNEVQTRSQADGALQNSLNTETQNRISGDTALDNKYSGITSDIKAKYFPISTGTGTYTLTGSNPLQFNYPSVVFSSIVTANGTINDSPGVTSNTLSTTAWVDANYANVGNFNNLQGTVNAIKSSAALTYFTVNTSLPSLQIGPYATVGSGGGVAIGSDTSAGGNYATAIGLGSTASGNTATVIGPWSTASGKNSMAIGNNANATADSTISFGTNSTSGGVGSTIIGTNASTNSKYSAAIGYFSAATEDNTVSVGYGNGPSPSDTNAPQYRRITNVADGTEPHDAVTLEQFNAAVNNATSAAEDWVTQNYETKTDAQAISSRLATVEGNYLSRSTGGTVMWGIDVKGLSSSGIYSYGGRITSYITNVSGYTYFQTQLINNQYISATIGAQDMTGVYHFWLFNSKDGTITNSDGKTVAFSSDVLPLNGGTNNYSISGGNLSVNYSSVTFNTGIPTISSALPDVPGNSSNNIATTAWIDKYYIPRATALNIKYIGIDNTLNNTSVGNNTVVTNSGNTTIGSGSKATGTNCTSIGLNAFSTGYSSTALGNTVSSTGKYSVAIGAFSSTGEDNVVSVGSGVTNSADPNAPLYRRITNVADGKNPNDAVNIEQLNAAAMNAASPVGTIMAFAGSGKIANYLLCDGGTFDPVAYPDLYKLLGTTNVPDLRGMFLRGLDTTGNIDNVAGGRKLLSFEDGSYIQGDRVGYTRTLNQISSISGPSNWTDSTQPYTSSMASLGWDVPVNYGPPYPPTSYGGSSQEYRIGTTVDSNGNIIYKTSSQVNGITRPKNVAVNYYIRALPPTSGTIATDGSGGSSTGNSATKDWVESYFASVTDFNNLKSEVASGASNNDGKYLPLAGGKIYNDLHLGSGDPDGTNTTHDMVLGTRPNSDGNTNVTNNGFLSVLRNDNTAAIWTFDPSTNSVIDPNGNTLATTNEIPDLSKAVLSTPSGSDTKAEQLVFHDGDPTKPMVYDGTHWNQLLVANNPQMVGGFLAKTDDGSYLAFQNTDSNLVMYNHDGSVRWGFGGKNSDTSVFYTESITANMVQISELDGVNDSKLNINPINNTNGYVCITQDGGVQQAGMLEKNIGQYSVAVSNNNFQNYASWTFDLATRKLIAPSGNTYAEELIGPPIPWPTLTPPAGYLIMDGGAFDTTKYPKLAAIYTTGKLPDLRGVFIRGYDPTGIMDSDGPSRGILSYQEGSSITGDTQSGHLLNFTNINNQSPPNPNSALGCTFERLGWDRHSGYGTTNSMYECAYITNGSVFNGWGDPAIGITRPKNINFYYIVKAG